MSETPTFFIDWQAIPARPLAPGVTIRVFASERTMLSLVEVEPNGVVPLHHHPHEQMGIWLEGEARVTIGGVERTVHPGDSYVIPGDVEHTFTVGPTRALALDIFNPPREDYLGPSPSLPQ